MKWLEGLEMLAADDLVLWNLTYGEGRIVRFRGGDSKTLLGSLNDNEWTKKWMRTNAMNVVCMDVTVENVCNAYDYV